MKINRRSNRCKTWLHRHPGTVRVLLQIQKRRGHPFCVLYGDTGGPAEKYDLYITSEKHRLIMEAIMKQYDAHGKVMMERIIEPMLAEFGKSFPPPFISTSTPTPQPTTAHQENE